MEYTPEDFATTPPDLAKQRPPRFALSIRWGSWLLNNAGLFRWGSIPSAKPNKKGVRVKRFAWVKIYPRQ